MYVYFPQETGTWGEFENKSTTSFPMECLRNSENFESLVEILIMFQICKYYNIYLHIHKTDLMYRTNIAYTMPYCLLFIS